MNEEPDPRGRPGATRAARTGSMALLERYQGGDRAALGLLLDRYQDRLRRIVRIRMGGRLRERIASTDLVQDVNLIAVKKLEDFEPQGEGSLLRWLAGIATLLCRESTRRHCAERRDLRREKPLDAVPSGEVDAGTGSGALPEERLWRAEVREILDECVSRLPEERREVIVLRDYCELSWAEVAEEMGRESPEAARKLHGRAWIELRRSLKPRLGSLV